MSLRKILHVDDDHDIREICRLALVDISGYEVIQCSSGTGALKALENFFPDLILLDEVMPSLTGEETLSRLRQSPEFAKIPVVFITAQSNQSSRERLIKTGALDVVTKPFDPITLGDELLAIFEGAV